MSYLRGKLHEERDDLEQAVFYYREALQRNPYHSNAAFSLASCENKRGNFDEACETYENALQRDKRRSQEFRLLRNSLLCENRRQTYGARDLSASRILSQPPGSLLFGKDATLTDNRYLLSGTSLGLLSDSRSDTCRSENTELMSLLSPGGLENAEAAKYKP